METNSCQCVFPAATEEQIVLIEGSEPGTALRVYLQAGHDGYVRLQQLAHDPGLGWYVQKSMIVPGEMLRALVPQLRNPVFLLRRATAPTQTPLPFIKLTLDSFDPVRRRRDAGSIPLITRCFAAAWFPLI